ncbi:MAG: Fe(2+) transporter permease subunit FeoB [Pseudomonadales bacterium]|nr:Fe(2+) transporter permease subunit FeoB [Gammaproteobacteria bacterium]MBK6582539.1 Fe(2+) transporter permease subunit FeoB [Gammaproteobacteria bacterium]MBK9667827.1 Fe(2+) transporter permease subunit FeoB [Gammaproteobacteria bacterium]MBP6051032.1 Fe(2+) transporter permease subunit FeoB [Pseudomonadales bacterium]MBP6229206.1 Fe(2+) transporter permease subunit FeoB [Pseudomonadales bacterium]
MNRPYTIALVGNPNCGKTTLFNRLTGTHQAVGNWPGVTVERKTGRFVHAGAHYDVVDLPGTFSLHVSPGEDSLDQQIAQGYVLSREADLIINIIDASSVERGLYLSSQIFDASIPVVVALNMMDVAHGQGIHVDPYRLAEGLGCPVVPLVASRGDGIGALMDVVGSQLLGRQPAPARQPLDAPIESALLRVQAALDTSNAGPNGRLLAAALLERDAAVLARLGESERAAALTIVGELETQLGASAGDALIAARYRAIGDLTAQAVHRDPGHRFNLTDWLDRVLLDRWLAFPLFLGVMYLMFMLTINVGGAFTDFFNITAGALFVEVPRRLLEAVGLPAWLVTAIADGVGGGVQLVCSFIPVIATLFLFQSFLEDSGYMARAAFILDRLMRAVGLPGKSFVPLIVGFGCNVPAVMATRSLDTHQDRLLTSMMAPFMSCGARLTVYALFAAAIFPRNGQNVVFALYLIGIALAIITGLLIRRGLLNRDLSPFLLELPAYHVPTLRSLMLHTWHRLKGFVMRAGKAIVLVVLVLNFVNSIGTDGSYGNQNTERSMLSAVGKAITPLFAPIGITEENWPATVGIFSGVFAKEVVVGTLDALYTNMAREPGSSTGAANIGAMLSEAIDSVGTNLGELGERLADPLGLSLGNLDDRDIAAADQQVHVGTLGLMAQLFDGPLGAFSYILFVLLYMPCVATLGAIYKELGGFWAFFSATWNTVIAYTLAVACYQGGRIASDPLAAGLWLVFCALLLSGCYLWLMHLGRRRAASGTLIPVVNL